MAAKGAAPARAAPVARAAPPRAAPAAAIRQAPGAFASPKPAVIPGGGAKIQAQAARLNAVRAQVFAMPSPKPIVLPGAGAKVAAQAAKVQQVRAGVFAIPSPKPIPARPIAANVARLRQVQENFKKVPSAIPVAPPVAQQFQNAVSKLRQFIQQKDQQLPGVGLLNKFHDRFHGRDGVEIPLQQLPLIEERAADLLNRLSPQLEAAAVQAPPEERQVLGVIDQELKAHASRASEEAVAAGNLIAMQNDFEKTKKEMQLFHEKMVAQLREATKGVVDEARKARVDPAFKQQAQGDFEKKVGLLQNGLEKLDKFDRRINELIAQVAKSSEKLEEIKKESDAMKHLKEDVEKLQNLKTVQNDRAFLSAVSQNADQLRELAEKVNALSSLIKMGYCRVRQDLSVQVTVNTSERASLFQQIAVAVRIFRGQPIPMVKPALAVSANYSRN